MVMLSKRQNLQCNCWYRFDAQCLLTDLELIENIGGRLKHMQDKGVMVNLLYQSSQLIHFQSALRVHNLKSAI